MSAVVFMTKTLPAAIVTAVDGHFGRKSHRVVETSGGGNFGRWKLREVETSGGGNFGRWRLRTQRPLKGNKNYDAISMQTVKFGNFVRGGVYEIASLSMPTATNVNKHLLRRDRAALDT